jgi:hypothetical protein
MKTLAALFLMLMLCIIEISAQVAINKENLDPDASAMLDVYSTDKGVLIPRMTGEQRDAIDDPAEGLLVYCTDCTVSGAPDGSLSIYLSGIWKTFTPCICSQPAAGEHITSTGQVTWKWNAATGATGYRWNASNHYTSANDLDTNRTVTETGLAPGTYTRFVWAYNVCGISEMTILTQTLSY